jgi:hypothetical protein
MPNTLIPQYFEAPTLFNSEYFHLRVLEESVAELDFEAVMSSKKRLQGIFGLESQWPKTDMSIEENIESLKVHKQEFESKVAFAYTVFNNSKKKCLGSVYIDPSQSPNYDCEVYLWIRDDSIALEKVLYQTVLNWLKTSWPFSKVVFPGRSISWEDWTNELKIV